VMLLSGALLGISSSAALFVSGVVLRLSYQPYAEIVRRFVRDGDETGLSSFRDFLGRAYAPMGSGWLGPRQHYPLYFWFAVIFCARSHFSLPRCAIFKPARGPAPRYSPVPTPSLGRASIKA
jgi:hypothetical protein